MSAAGTAADADACSRRSVAAGEPLEGSAPLAGSWIVIEEPGPWGRDALRDSSVPAQLADFLEQLAATAGTRAITARHAQRRKLHDQPRNVWIANSDPTVPGGPQLRHTMVEQLTEILQWELQDLADGKLPDIGRVVPTPMEFICTHSGRDACCALFGRARARQRPQSWECSHLGGHRFAATSVVLPFGAVFGRLGPMDALDTEHLRGVSYLAPALQVAEIAVRRSRALSALDPLKTRYAHHTPDTEPSAPGTIWAQVSDGHGNSWSVRCESSSIVRPASCHADASEATIWRAVELTANRPDPTKERK